MADSREKAKKFYHDYIFPMSAVDQFEQRTLGYICYHLWENAAGRPVAHSDGAHQAILGLVHAIGSLNNVRNAEVAIVKNKEKHRYSNPFYAYK